MFAALIASCAMPRAQFTKVAILTPATARISALAIACPLACSTIGLTGKDFDPSLLGLVIATPSAFSISAAYQRREKVLEGLAQMRARTWTLHQSAVRWGSRCQAGEIDLCLQRMWLAFVRHLRLVAAGKEKEALKALDDTYDQLQKLGVAIDNFRLDPPAQNAGGVDSLASIMCSDERLIAQNVEEVRVVAGTETPTTLRGFTVWASTLFPIVFAPYFAAISLEDSLPWAAYIQSLFYAVTINALVSIQTSLEDPFDGDSPDDIDLSLWGSPVGDFTRRPNDDWCEQFLATDLCDQVPIKR